MVRAFTAVELKSYNAILVPPIYQKKLAAVEAKQNFFADLLQCTSIYRCALQHSSKRKKYFFIPTPIKIMQHTFFFSFLLSYLNLTVYSHHHPQALIISFISQALISLISQPTPSPSQPTPSPTHAILAQPTPSQPTSSPAHAISATPSLSVKLSSLSSPSPRCPVLPTPPIHASAQSSDQTHAISLFSLL